MFSDSELHEAEYESVSLLPNDSLAVILEEKVKKSLALNGSYQPT